MRRIVCVQQILTGIVDVPLALLINPQQYDIKTALINRINDIFGRLQRHFVFCRFSPKNNSYPLLRHLHFVPV
ncbi:hypothetical protein D3C81_1268090 [compost metagenome]